MWKTLTMFHLSPLNILTAWANTIIKWLPLRMKLNLNRMENGLRALRKPKSGFSFKKNKEKSRNGMFSANCYENLEKLNGGCQAILVIYGL